MGDYLIETEQLALRELMINDLQSLHQISSDEETMQYYPSAFDMDKKYVFIL